MRRKPIEDGCRHTEIATSVRAIEHAGNVGVAFTQTKGSRDEEDHDPQDRDHSTHQRRATAVRRNLFRPRTDVAANIEEGMNMKKIQIRKTETIRLTSAAQPLYAGGCDTPIVIA